MRDSNMPKKGPGSVGPAGLALPNSAHQRYEVLERLADLVMAEAALAKKEASA